VTFCPLPRPSWRGEKHTLGKGGRHLPHSESWEMSSRYLRVRCRDARCAVQAGAGGAAGERLRAGVLSAQQPLPLRAHAREGSAGGCDAAGFQPARAEVQPAAGAGWCGAEGALHRSARQERALPADPARLRGAERRRGGHRAACGAVEGKLGVSQLPGSTGAMDAPGLPRRDLRRAEACESGAMACRLRASAGHCP
jgi:hypothetical protein